MFQLDFFLFFFVCFFFTLFPEVLLCLSRALVMEVWGARTKLSIWWIICRCLHFGTIHIFWIIKLKRKKKDHELRFYSKVSVTILFMLLNALDCLPVKETLTKFSPQKIVFLQVPFFLTGLLHKINLETVLQQYWCQQ